MFFNPTRSNPTRFKNPSARRARARAGARATQRASEAASEFWRRSLVESLESRVLLTTVLGGGPGRTRTFEFLDGNNNDIRVALRGTIVAELLGLNLANNTIVNMQTNLNSTTPGFDLFSIYIAQADMDSSISIARVPKPPATPRPMQPFTGGAGSFTISDATTGMLETINPAGTTGQAFLGGRTPPDATINPGTPILTVRLTTAFGARPADPSHKIVAGLQTAPGVSIGQFLFGGTIMGKVDIEGSCNLFYAGQLWTGDGNGLFRAEQPTFRQNFYVGGDLRALVTAGTVGALDLDNDPIENMSYKTGFDMRVKGRMGGIYTRDSFLGAVTVFNDPSLLGVGTPIPEIETRSAPFPSTSSESNFQGNPFGQDERHRAPSLGDTALFTNDTIATAQLVGTSRSANNSGNIVAEITGQLDGTFQITDNVDYYQMGVLAGQSIQVQLTPDDPLAFMQVAVFDSDNRMVASDYSNHDADAVRNQPFRFTADRPGVYKFAVAWTNDLDFNGVQSGVETAPPASSGLTNYTLLLTRTADIGFAGIVARGNIANTDQLDPNSFNASYSPTIDLEEGDLGALLTEGGGNQEGSVIFMGSSGVARPITVKHGNLRAMDADSIGVERVNEPVGALDLLVPRGAVGLLRSRGTDAVSQLLSVNLDFVVLGAGTFNPKNAIGFDYQVVDSATIFAGNLMANRGIGIIRADQISTPAIAPRLAVNADNRGNDGFIDLIDCRNSFGTLTAGGPQITTGNSGNVRYIHVGNPSLVFRDRFFGGGSNEQTLLNPGESFRYTDDSGASVKLSTLPAVGLTTPGIEQGALLVETYGIRDKGGSVLIDVDVLPGVNTTDGSSIGRGLQIDTGGNGGTGTAEIGSVNIFSPGTNFIFNPATRTFTASGADAQTPGQNSDVLMKGKLRIDVFDLSAQDPTSPGNFTGFTSIDNRTTGEIANIEASSIGLLQGQNLGVAFSKTKASLQGISPQDGTPRTNVSPFSQQNELIRVTGDIQTIRARGALGNLLVGPTTPTGFIGNIGELSANTDGVHTDPTLVEGIIAPVVTARSMLNVNIGEQLAPSGTGNFEQSGLFAGGAIASVTNQGTGSDIRGDIVSRALTITLPTTGLSPALPGATITDSRTGLVLRTVDPVAGIGTITLNNGAIINADLMVTNAFTDALELPRPFLLPGPFSGFFPTILNNFEGININGIGGIIGSEIAVDTMGSINIKGGFGFINSSIDQQANSTVDGIDTDGYGMRHSAIEGGATLDHITARGTGKLLNTLTYTPSVRQSETQQFDPYTGQLITSENDLHLFLGTSRANPVSADQSVSGSIEDTTLSGSRDLNSVSAFRIFGRPFETDPVTLLPLMRISFAENIGKMSTTQDVDGLELTAGVLKLAQTGRNFLNDTFSINNILTSMIAGGNIKASTTIEALSGEGRIDSITTGLALFGRVSASQRIGKLNIGSDLGSPSVSSSHDITFAHINGSILNGALLRAANNINQLIIGHNVDTGGTVRARRILSQTILGQVRGDIIVG